MIEPTIGVPRAVGVLQRQRVEAVLVEQRVLHPLVARQDTHTDKTVGENMGFALKMRGVSTEERTATVAQAAKILVTVGVRPEQLGIVQHDSSHEGFAAKVDLVEELGSESYLYAHLDDPRVADLEGRPVSLVAKSAVRAPAKIGESIGLSLLDGPVHLFHPETGDRIRV